MQSFLRFATHPSTTKDVAPTIYYLRKAGRSFSPQLEPELLRLSSESLYHFPIEKVLSLILSSKKTTFGWKYSLPELGESARIYQSQKPPSHKLLLVSLFFDEFRKSLGTRTLIDALVLRVDNIPQDIHFVLALLEPQINKFEFVEKTLIPCLQRLEKGEFQSLFYPSGEIEFFFGGLNLVLGDHMGQIGLSCIPGPTSITQRSIDRFLMIPPDQISQIKTQSQIKSLMRDPAKTLTNVRKARVELKEGTQKQAQIYLQEVGLTGISPFWKLKIFRMNFFQRFGICRLHLILLGHTLFVLLNLGNLRCRHVLS